MVAIEVSVKIIAPAWRINTQQTATRQIHDCTVSGFIFKIKFDFSVVPKIVLGMAIRPPSPI
jgi:hypothetical protein